MEYKIKKPPFFVRCVDCKGGIEKGRTAVVVMQRINSNAPTNKWYHHHDCLRNALEKGITIIDDFFSVKEVQDMEAEKQK